ncbi:hypothetical protein Tco_1028442 [Tanacetum coccineum]|uniref:Uncharacterized protein n=1 Tax=Tanacetum coccineum TaxID=301880 RepID=A0ABQ5G0N1_9ASTR
MSISSLNSPWCLTRILGHEVFKCHDTRALGAPEQAQQRLLWPCLSATASIKAAACGGYRHALGARLRLYPLAKYDGTLVRANKHDGFTFLLILQMACSLPHTDSEVKALVQRLINEDKGRQDVLLNLAFQFEDSCAVRVDLRKAYEKCNDISQESRALICTLLKESSEKDRKLHLSMYGKAAQLEKQIDAKSAWFQEKYSDRTPGGMGCSSSQANCPLTEKELHQLRMDEEALREKIRQEQAENNAFFLEFGIVRYDSEYESSD